MGDSMLSESEQAERAEFIQSVKALFIPSSLFLACVIMAAGSFLIANHEPVGWAFVVVSLATVASAFVCLIRFQNKHRAAGLIDEAADTMVDEPTTIEDVDDFVPEEIQAHDSAAPDTVAPQEAQVAARS